MKQATLVVETPERVMFTYAVAESSSRAAAFCLDLLLQALVILVFSIPVFAGGLADELLSFHAFLLIFLFFTQWGYGFLFECLLSGRTPGKAAFRIRVVRRDGLPLDARTVAVRNVLRAADGLPFMIAPLFGGFVSVADPLSRRLGDILADTVVVRDGARNPSGAARETFVDTPPLPACAVPLRLPPGTRLSERELLVLRKYLRDRGKLAPAREAISSRELSEKVAARLGIGTGESLPVPFLESAYKAHLPVASVRFMHERIGRVRALEAMMTSAPRSGVVPDGKAADFLGLYRLICSDLAAARSAGLSQDVVGHLNSVAGEARGFVYSAPPAGLGALARGFAFSVPRTIASRWRFLLAAAVLFVVPFFLAERALSSGRGIALVDPALLSRMAASYESIEFGGRDGDETAYMTSYYIANNVGIDFASMAGGAFFGLGTVFFIVENGLTLGGVFGHVRRAGYGAAIERFTAAHTPFELSGLVLSGAAGLLLGWTLIRGGPRGRLEAVRGAMGDFIKLGAAAAVLTFSAAFIEAGLGLSPLSVEARRAVAACCWAVIGAWLAFPLISGHRALDGIRHP